jgi:hypothetical protein
VTLNGIDHRLVLRGDFNIGGTWDGQIGHGQAHYTLSCFALWGIE